VSENRLLAALPRAEYDRLIGGMGTASFATGQVVYQAGGPLRHVYFPRSGAFTLTVLTAEGGTVAVGLIGHEGMLGLAAFHGAVRTRTETVCLLGPATAWRMSGDRFQWEAGRPGPFRELLHRYTRVMFDQVAQTAACRGSHDVPARCASWLLACRDRAGRDEFPLTHESLAMTLGVRRAGVSEAAGALQADGLIRYRRGRVEVLDRKRLEVAACECYRITRDDSDRLAH
jgi:CRP-like cAMP-binding protein